MSVPLAELCDFLELHQRLLKLKVVDGIAEVIETRCVDHPDYGLAQHLESFLRLSVVSLEQRLETAHRRSRAFQVEGHLL